MSMHQLRSVTIGVPDPAAVAVFYQQFGLHSHASGEFSTTDGGRQLVLEEAASRRLVEMVIGVDEEGDVARVDAALSAAGHDPQAKRGILSVVEPETGVRVTLRIVPRLSQTAGFVETFNGPGRIGRPGKRSPAVLRHDRVLPRKLGHVVLTTTDLTASSRFFTDLIGFKVSDYIGGVGVFLRCSTDHHNLLLLSAPVVYLHHTAWQVDDVDEVGRGGAAMIDGHPDRHVWGLGRHHAGSNFFWYLRDPAGNYCEYYADLDYIPEDAEWRPESHEGRLGIYNWGPPPPPSFLHPDDLTALIAARRALSA